MKIRDFICIAISLLYFMMVPVGPNAWVHGLPGQPPWLAFKSRRPAMASSRSLICAPLGCKSVVRIGLMIGGPINGEGERPLWVPGESEPQILWLHIPAERTPHQVPAAATKNGAKGPV